MKIDKEKAITVGQAILCVVGLTAFVAFTAVVPGALTVLKTFGFEKQSLKRREYYIDDSLKRLVKKRLIAVVVKNGVKQLKLTLEGKRALFKVQSRSLIKIKPKKWDGKYRVVIFDIKESLKFVRNDVRYTLIQFGFIKLQNSVWVYPYPCEGVINLLKTNLEIGDELIYMNVDSIENDKWLRDIFSLPSK
jgi:DNA-binding transcriptional regulator PaaX